MPMNPEHLPLLALLIAVVFVGGVALRDLLARRWLAALRAGAIALLALVLAFVGGTHLGKHEKPRITRLPGLVRASAASRPGSPKTGSSLEPKGFDRLVLIPTRLSSVEVTMNSCACVTLVPEGSRSKVASGRRTRPVPVGPYASETASAGPVGQYRPARWT